LLLSEKVSICGMDLPANAQSVADPALMASE
jgi:hypothetical protein